MRLERCIEGVEGVEGVDSREDDLLLQLTFTFISRRDSPSSDSSPRLLLLALFS